MPYPHFLMRLRAAAMRQISLINAIAIATGAAGQEGAMHMVWLEQATRL